MAKRGFWTPLTGQAETGSHEVYVGRPRGGLFGVSSNEGRSSTRPFSVPSDKGDRAAKEW